MKKIVNNLNKILIIISAAILVWIILDLFVLNGQALFKKDNSNQSKISSEQVGEKVDEDIFYWGDSCPYCQDVKDWMTANNVEEKIVVLSKEIYNNQSNSAELTARAKSCGMDTQRIGVPFLYTVDGQCLVGSPQIIEYLATKIAE